MSATNGKENKSNLPAKKPYDLSVESSKRGDEEATRLARIAESDDVNEETNLGQVNSKDGDKWGENKIATLDD